MPEPPRSVFQYAIVRVVPRVERGESLNVGVVLLCRPRRYLGARIALDEQRLAAFAPDLDPATIRPHLEAIERIAAGDPSPGRSPRSVRRSGSTGWSRRPARSSSRRRSIPGCATTRRPSSTTWSPRSSTSPRRSVPRSGPRPRRPRPRATGRGAARGDLDDQGHAVGPPVRALREGALEPIGDRAGGARAGLGQQQLERRVAPVRTARSVSRASARMTSAIASASRSTAGSGGRPLSSTSRTDAGRP